jgi:hypothetical protein
LLHRTPHLTSLSNASCAYGVRRCAKLLYEDELAVVGACPLLAVRDADGATAATLALTRGHVALAELLDAHAPADDSLASHAAAPSASSSLPSPSSSSLLGGGDLGGGGLGRLGGAGALSSLLGGGLLGGGGPLGSGPLGGALEQELLQAMGGGGGGATKAHHAACNGSSGGGGHGVNGGGVQINGGGGSGGGGGADSLSVFERSELTCLIDVLSSLGERQDPPLSAQQASCVAKLGGVLATTLFATSRRAAPAESKLPAVSP